MRWLVVRSSGPRGPSTTARKATFVGAVALCTASMLVPFPRGEAVPVALVCVATFGVSVFAATYIGMLADLFPHRLSDDLKHRRCRNIARQRLICTIHHISHEIGHHQIHSVRPQHDPNGVAPLAIQLK